MFQNSSRCIGSLLKTLIQISMNAVLMRSEISMVLTHKVLSFNV